MKALPGMKFLTNFNMQLIIDSYGIDLAIDNNRLTIQKGGVVKHLVPSKLTAIHVFTSCTLTSPVVVWAAVNDIPMLLYNNKGQVAARLWQPHFGSHAAIRIRQIHFCQSADACIWLKQLLLKKAIAQLHLHKQLPVQSNHAIITERISILVNRLKNDTGINLNWLRSIEAGISRWYWAGVAHALRNHIKLNPRKIRPAKDKFNALLNYLYGTLYGIVEGCLLAAGLDPHISIMHRMEYNTPSFVFDVIEPFRHWADEFLVQQVLKGALKPGYTEEKNGTILLTPEGKKAILTQWFIYLNERIAAPKKMIKRKDQVQQLCSGLAAQLLKQHKELNKSK